MMDKLRDIWNRQPRWIRIPAQWIALPIIAAFALLLIVDEIIMPWYTRQGDEFPAPDLVNQSIHAAQDRLEDIGSSMKIAERRFSPDSPDGTILEQRPPAGAPIKHGRVFSLVVSRGSELIDVPHVRGYTPRQAELILTQAGLHVGGHAGERDTTSNPVPVGTVVRTIPGAGSSLPRGGVINLLVNEPTDRRSTWCPNLVGLNIEEARKILRDRALLIGSVDRRYDTTLLPGTIIAQSHAPGEELDAGIEVDLVISRDQ
ncbi:MAG: PASTA domain-containing protein [candidate division Zixibacteria bacterium]|nr:PASTA domain-containing protein [candidate division Zixibacteria bacterium]